MPETINIARLVMDMRRNQWKSEGQLREIQLGRLNSLLAHASASVPAYRPLSGVRLSSLEDLGKLPIVTKEMMRADADSFVSARADRGRLYRMPTSGSTGIPFNSYYDAGERENFIALRYYTYLESGLRPFDIQAHLTYGTHTPHPTESLGLFRCRYIDMRLPTTEALRAIRESRASALFANPTLYHTLTLQNDLEGRKTRFRLLFSFAEPLDAETRRAAEESYGCRVIDRYGTAEAGAAAWECPEGSMHVLSDSTIIEILDKDGNPARRGEAGTMVLTPLWRRSMPFIRYRVGDVAAFGGPCRCGRGHPVLKFIRGRENDYIILPSGRRYWGTAICIHLRRLKGIAQFQAVQERDGELTLKIVPSDRASPPSEKEAAEALLASLPERMGVNVEFTDHIPRNRRGKLAHFISKMRSKP